MESVVDDDVSEPVIVNGQLGTAFRTAWRQSLIDTGCSPALLIQSSIATTIATV